VPCRSSRCSHLLLFVAIVGLGTSGTQTLIYGFVANYFRTNVRGAAVAWCAGFGRLGGVGGPLLGGLLVTAGLALNSIFYVLGGLALLGVVLTLLVPTRSVQPDRSTTTLRPSRRAAVANASGASSSGNRCEVDHDRSTAPRTASAIARR
jgi:MFS transporter, AAHS family, benzoate transport protein